MKPSVINITKVCNEELYTEVSKELNLPESLVKDIVSTQSSFTLETIKRGAFESIRYVYIGAITAKHKQIQKINDVYGKLKDKI